MLRLCLVGCFKGTICVMEGSVHICVPSLQRKYRLIGGSLCRLFLMEGLREAARMSNPVTLSGNLVSILSLLLSAL